MPRKKGGDDDAAAGPVPFDGAPTRSELQELFDARDLNLLKKMGGVEGLASRLKSSEKSGLTDDEDTLSKRAGYYGRNVYPQPKSPSYFEIYRGTWSDEAVIILTVGAIVALIGGIIEEVVGTEENGWIDGVAILVAVLLVTNISAWNDWMKDRQFQALYKKNQEDMEQRVIRKGEDSKLNLSEIVVGDIVPIFAGDQVPADGLFIPEGEPVACDESSMTGEPEPQDKSQRKPFMLSGTFVTKGAGRMLVCKVGANSEWGILLAGLEREDEDTPLQEKLGAMVVLIGKIGVVVAVVVFLVLLGYWIYHYTIPPYKANAICYSNPPNGSTGTPLCGGNGTIVKPGAYRDPRTGKSSQYVMKTTFQVDSLLVLLSAFIIAVTLVVVAVPEGLPLAVIISLAYSVRQMTKDQNLVRHLQACEIMGGATDICSDKTGTLTENKMAVVAGYMSGFKFETVKDLTKLLPDVRSVVAEALCVNTNDGSLIRDPKMKDVDMMSADALKVFKFVGSTTECALLVLAARLGFDYLEMIEKHPKVFRWNFTSARKRMSTIIAHPSEKGQFRLYCKGASEMVLQLCKKKIDEKGKIVKLKKKETKKLNAEIETLAGQGLRTIGLAYRDFSSKMEWSESPEGEGFENEMILIGIVGIEDPLRPEVPNAVKICQNAGITVRMVTGDNIITAKKIAQDCHIYDPEVGVALEGPVFNEMKDEEVLEIVDKLQVLARSKPLDKLRLVKILKQKGHVVSVTGDGTNDGPALREADVGLAMGIAGTEVARQAADIIILDDNFTSIVKSVVWGRAVFDNIRKFLQFQLTVNVVALAVSIIGAFTDRGTPMTAVQLLWLNLIMDTFGALALGTEKPSNRLLLRTPYGREGSVVTATMLRYIIGQAIFQCIVLFIILFATTGPGGQHLIFPWIEDGQYAYRDHLPSRHYTMIFNVFVFLQVFNEVSARKVGAKELNSFAGFFKNWLFSAVVVFITVVQIIMIQFGGLVMKTVPLNWYEFLICIGIGLFSLPVGFLVRLIPVRLEKWEEERDIPIPAIRSGESAE